jgi:hypothetical protein
MTAPLMSLLYVSTAAPGVEAPEVQQLIEAACRFNADHEVSGALLGYAGHFLQVLEGPADVVEALYGRIERDPRHHHVTLVHRGPITTRRFSGWAMRHVPLPQGHDRTVSGFLDELETQPSEDAAATALALLKRLSDAP